MLGVKLDKKGSCSAWRCPDFDCMGYVETSYDCSHGLCHICGAGCASCCWIYDCEFANTNIETQQSENRRNR